jgi:predicted dienelactone hydrolase
MEIGPRSKFWRASKASYATNYSIARSATPTSRLRSSSNAGVTGDNRDDESYPASRWMVDRPRHIRRVLDYMLGSWSGHERIDAARIGMFGFSAGGYTALVAIGGVPDLKAIAQHCAEDQGGFACIFGVADGAGKPGAATRSAPIWIHEPRIRAAVVAAPGSGFAFEGQALAHVTIPVQLWAASNDQNVPFISSTAIILRALPRPPEFHEVEGAGHFAFLPPCDPKLKAALPEVWATTCIDAPGFDRAVFHQRFNTEIVTFFDKSLATH